MYSQWHVASVYLVWNMCPPRCRVLQAAPWSIFLLLAVTVAEALFNRCQEGDIFKLMCVSGVFNHECHCTMRRSIIKLICEKKKKASGECRRAWEEKWKKCMLMVSPFSSVSEWTINLSIYQVSREEANNTLEVRRQKDNCSSLSFFGAMFLTLKTGWGVNYIWTDGHAC